jgi:hypothetical protein
MDNPKSLFDIENIKDLPVEMLRELRLVTPANERVLRVFSQSNRPLVLDEMIVGYYRIYKEIKSRHYMLIACYRMMKKGLLISTKQKGGYKLSGKAEAFLSGGKNHVSCLPDEPRTKNHSGAHGKQKVKEV